MFPEVFVPPWHDDMKNAVLQSIFPDPSLASVVMLTVLLLGSVMLPTLAFIPDITCIET